MLWWLGCQQTYSHFCSISGSFVFVQGLFDGHMSHITQPLASGYVKIDMENGHL
jgi:hypothetical protein